MNKMYPVVSQLMSAGLIAALYVYIKLSGAFFLGQAYYQIPYGIAWELASIIVSYIIIELTVNRLKFSAGRKALILAAITLVPVVFLKLLL